MVKKINFDDAYISGTKEYLCNLAAAWLSKMKISERLSSVGNIPKEFGEAELHNMQIPFHHFKQLLNRKLGEQISNYQVR